MAILKLFHVFVVIVWMGSLLTLTRFLAYQAKEEPGFQLKLGKILKRMYFTVDLPAMVLTVASGITALIVKDVNMKAPWLHMKLTFVFFLIVCDLDMGRSIVLRAKEPVQGKGTRFKVLHSVAGLLFIAVLIAIYVVKKIYCIEL